MRQEINREAYIWFLAKNNEVLTYLTYLNGESSQIKNIYRNLKNGDNRDTEEHTELVKEVGMYQKWFNEHWSHMRINGV